MKECPQCSQTYTDEINYCLADGAPLILANITEEEATVLRKTHPAQENVTAVKPHREEITIARSAQTNSPQLVQPTPAQNGVSPIFAYLSFGLILLLIVGGIAIAGLYFISGMLSGGADTEVARGTNNSNGQNRIEDPQANLREQRNELEKDMERLANERKKLEEAKNKPTAVATPLANQPPTAPAATPANAPKPPQPTSRIKFGRGNVSQSVSGKVSSQRSFVLEARSGQYLSASVNGGGCVTFSNGGTSIGFTTVNGDNRLTLINNCNNEAGFTLTVTIQ